MALLFTAFALLSSPVQAATSTATTITGFTSPYGVAITPNGAYAYITNEGNASVSVIDTATNKVITIIPVESDPIG